MFLRQLLLITLVWHVFGLSYLAAPDSPPPTADGESNLWDNIQDVVDEPEFYIPAAGVGVVFVVLVAAKGWGKFHVNQFRIYFTLNEPGAGESTHTELTKTLVNKFDECFTNNPVARAEIVEPNPPHVVVKFVCKLRVARLLGRYDYVELVSIGDASFIAKTLGQERRDASFIAKTLGQGRSIWEQHFLSGVRSWCIVEVDAQDQRQPQGNSDSNNGKIYFLETAALERYTNIAYRWMVNREHIHTVWIHFLCDAVVQLAATPIDYGIPNNQETLGVWKTGPDRKVWMREVEYSKKELPLLEEKTINEEIFDYHPGIKEYY